MAKDKTHIKAEMGKHANQRDRFKTWANGVIDQAKEMITAGASTTDQLAALEGLRSQLDEAYDDIDVKGKK
jgi:hypothetical protein